MNESHVILSTGDKMPVLGLGTWKSPPGEAGSAVEYALTEAGYRHIDGAAIYRNEKEIGEAYARVFGKGIVNRDDVFVTSKLWNTNHGGDRVRLGCERTLADLQLDYLDLYLVHWGVAIPAATDPQVTTGTIVHAQNDDGFLATEPIPMQETWGAMEELVRSGLVKAIGVANFTGPMLLDLLVYATIPPAINQVELHPYLSQQTLVDYCVYRGVAVTAYSPLGSPGNYAANGGPSLISDPVIMEIARRHAKSPAQVLIRWAIDRGTVAIPKSVTPARIEANIDVFDFALTEEDLAAIATLDRGHRFVDPFTPLKFPYFA